MAQVCRVCAHPARADLERALVSGQAVAALARQFGVSRQSITGHRDNHLAANLAEAHREAELERHVDLLGQLDQLHAAGVSLLRSSMTGRLVVPTIERDGVEIPVGDVTPVVDVNGRWLEGDVDDPQGLRWAQPRIALRAIREVRGTLELLARIEGELEPEETTVTVVFDDEWVTGQ